MLRTNSKAVNEKIKSYILENVDIDYINEFFKVDENDYTEICGCILQICEKEKFYQRYKSRFDMFKDWCQGLPSALNTLYYYNVSAVDLLGDILEQTEEERSKYSESDAEELMTKLLYRELSKREYGYLFCRIA